MNEPLERDLRLALDEAWRRSDDGTLSLAARFSDAFSDAAAVARGLWDLDDFRPSELERYDALLSAAIGGAQREAERALLDAFARALATFAAEHPDAPRT